MQGNKRFRGESKNSGVPSVGMFMFFGRFLIPGIISFSFSCMLLEKSWFAFRISVTCQGGRVLSQNIESKSRKPK